MIQLRNVAKTYTPGDPAALRIDSLDIPENQVVALVGFSGSGKTTLLNILGLLDPPDPAQGLSIRMESKELAGLNEGQSREQRRAFGFVFQQGYLLENLASRENLRIPPELNGFRPKPGVLDDMLLAVDLAKFVKRLPSELSAGQRQRVAIMRALSHRPKIVFADEPTSSLDFLNADRVVNILRTWQTDEIGRTLLLVTHDTALAVKYADTAILMAEGEASSPLSLKGLIAEDLSSKLDAFTATVRKSGAAEDRSGALDGSTATVRKSAAAAAPSAASGFIVPSHPPSPTPKLDRLKVDWRLAWHDVFAPATGAWRKVIPFRILQFHSVASLSLALFLALLFARLFLALAGYLVSTVSDPYMNQVKVLRHRVSAQGLGKEDLEKVSNLAWVNNKVQGVPPEQKNARRLTLMASPARPVQITGAMTRCEYPSPCGYPILAVSVPANDRILSKIPVLEGPDLTHLKDSGRVVQSLFAVPGTMPNQSGFWDDSALDLNKRGIVCTPRTLRELGYKQQPQSVSVTMFTREGNQTQTLPVLGIAPDLPADKEALITEGFYLEEYRKGGPDPTPDYMQISLYVSDLLTDALPLYNALIDMDYVTPEGQRGRLVLAIQLISYVSKFQTVASFGLAIVVFAQLMRSFWDSIRRKERQIGVLLAYGVRKWDLYLTFCLEVGLIWGGAALFASVLDATVTRRLVTLAYQSIPNSSPLPALPFAPWAAIVFGSLVIALLCVIPALKTIKPRRVANMLKAVN